MLMRNVARKPIGVFDSGIGGLTVVKALIAELPQESIVYFGDTARVPYGSKSKGTIVKFSMENVEFLLRFGVKSIVIACNTASSWALPTLRRYFRVPVVGVIRPGARAAVRLTRNRRIGVIGTQATIRSRAYELELKRLDPSVKVVSQSCPLFVPIVEAGWFAHDITTRVAETYLKPLKQAKVDTLILGCTHYPLLRETIATIMGPHVRLVDSAEQTAAEVKGLLDSNEWVVNGHAPPRHRFFVTDEPVQFRELGRQFLGRSIPSVERINHP
jgi:glutamate racemase